MQERAADLLGGFPHLPGPAWAAGQDVHRKGTEVRATRARVGQPAVLHQLAARGQSRSRKHPGRGLDAGAARAVHPGGGPGSGRSARATAAPPTFLGGSTVAGSRPTATPWQVSGGPHQHPQRSRRADRSETSPQLAGAGHPRPAVHLAHGHGSLTHADSPGRARESFARAVCRPVCPVIRSPSMGNPAHGPLPHSAHAFVWKRRRPYGKSHGWHGEPPDLGPGRGLQSRLIPSPTARIRRHTLRSRTRALGDIGHFMVRRRAGAFRYLRFHGFGLTDAVARPDARASGVDR